MGIIKLFRRLNSVRKLHRGQCDSCFKPLRDDASSRYCSDKCEEQFLLDSFV